MKKHRGVFEKVRDSGEFWIRYVDQQGKLRREKVGPKNLAITLYQKRKTEVLQGKKLPETIRRRPITFGEIARDALRDRPKRSARNDKAQMARLLAWFKHRPVHAITPGEIEQRLSEPPWSDATRNRYRALLSFIYRLALRHGKVTSNPVQLVRHRRENNVRKGFVNDAQYTRLAQAGPPLWMRTLLALAFTFGWRKGELLSLRVHQVDLSERTIRLEPGTTKNDEGRTITLTAETYELIKACVSGKEPHEYVLTREDASRVRDFSKTWADLCVQADLGRFVCRTCNAPGRPCPACSKAKRRTTYRYEGVIFHDLRRSAVRNLERAGVPRSVAMKITGHKTEAVYRRYAIVSPADLADASRRLEQSRLNSQNELTPQLVPTPGVEQVPSVKLI